MINLGSPVKSRLRFGSFSSILKSLNLLRRYCMNNKTPAIIATVVAVLLCGCPGLFLLCIGPLMAIISQVPGAEIDIFGSQDPTSALTIGIALLCVGLIFVAIPVVVGLVTLRKKPVPSKEPGEAIPPTG